MWGGKPITQTRGPTSAGGPGAQPTKNKKPTRPHPPQQPTGSPCVEPKLTQKATRTERCWDVWQEEATKKRDYKRRKKNRGRPSWTERYISNNKQAERKIQMSRGEPAKDFHKQLFKSNSNGRKNVWDCRFHPPLNGKPQKTGNVPNKRESRKKTITKKNGGKAPK